MGDVLAATDKLEGDAKQTSKFNAHLYLGLWYDVAGDRAKTKEPIFAAEARPIGHYMYDVAWFHAEKLRQEEGNGKSPEKASVNEK